MKSRRQKRSLRAKALVGQGKPSFGDETEQLSADNETEETYKGTEESPWGLAGENKNSVRISSRSVGLGLQSRNQDLGSTSSSTRLPSTIIQPGDSMAGAVDDLENEPLGSGEWDYSVTERWGWIILVTTWICFIVVMGSCLGVWSWAWDVGATPYAPPDLEDDATLPIVGYYPALMVLTAIMGWVWVFIAWLGVKYFKHARIQGDDG